MEEQYNERVAKHIWHDILQCSAKPLRWGFDLRTVKTIDRGTSFMVHTKFMDGCVKIQQDNKGNFKIGVKPESFGSELTYEDIPIDNLISTIDRVVREGILTDNTKPMEYRVAV